MIARCTRPTNKRFKDYGGRGISVDPRWREFTAFLADMGECPNGLTLERIDNNGNYTKENCKWATWAEQYANTRRLRLLTFSGKTMGVAAWARHLNVNVNVLYSRLDHHGWSIEETLSIPANSGRRKSLQLLSLKKK